MGLVEALHRSGLSLLRIEAQGLRIDIGKDGATIADSATATPGAQPAAADGVTIPSPHVGIFRAAPNSAQPGSTVEQASTLGSIETLDDVTAVTASVAGTVAERLVRDGDFVEYGQPLYRILPTAA